MERPKFNFYVFSVKNEEEQPEEDRQFTKVNKLYHVYPYDTFANKSLYV